MPLPSAVHATPPQPRLMDVQTVNLLYGLLAIVGIVILVWLAVLAVAVALLGRSG